MVPATMCGCSGCCCPYCCCPDGSGAETRTPIAAVMNSAMVDGAPSNADSASADADSTDTDAAGPGPEGERVI
jgi:hypothetical protein